MSYGQPYNLPPFPPQGGDGIDPNAPQGDGTSGGYGQQPMTTPPPPPDFYGASPAAQTIQALQGQLGQVYGQMPTRNLPEERRQALRNGLGGALVGLLARNARVGVTAATGAIQGGQQAAMGRYQNDLAVRQNQIGGLQAQIANEEKLVGPQLRYAGSAQHTSELAKAAATRDLGDRVTGFPKFLSTIRIQFPNATDLQLGQMLQNYVDEADTRAKALGYASSGLTVPTRITGNVPVTQGISPAGERYGVDQQSGDLLTPDTGNGVGAGIVRDVQSPHLAAPRPPILQTSAPFVPPDTSVADKAAAVKAVADAKAKTAAGTQLDKGLTGWAAFSSGLSRDPSIHNQRIGVQQWDQAHGTNFLAQFDNAKGLPKNPEDLARMASMARTQQETKLAPITLGIQQKNSDTQAKNAATSAGGLSLRRQEFSNRLTQQSKKAGAPASSGDPANWSPLRLQQELTRITKPSAGYYDAATKTHKPGSSYADTDAGRQYQASLESALATKQAQNGTGVRSGVSLATTAPSLPIASLTPSIAPLSGSPSLLGGTHVGPINGNTPAPRPQQKRHAPTGQFRSGFVKPAAPVKSGTVIKSKSGRSFQIL